MPIISSTWARVSANSRPALKAFWIALAASVALLASVADAATAAGEAPQPLRVTEGHRQTAARVLMYAEREHYGQISVDDQLSERTLGDYIDLLDGQHLYFLKNQEDYFLRTYGSQLDDRMRRGDLNPVFQIYQLFRARMTAYFDYAEEFLDSAPELRTEREWVLDREALPRPVSQAELNAVWRDRVRHDMINLILDERSYEEAVSALRKRYVRQRKALYSQDSDDVFALFMNAFTQALDPHSNYFSPHNYEEYRIQMSRAYHGVGASLSMQDDYVLVREVLPGGPADKDGRLRAGDRITGVDGSASGEVTDVVGWRLQDVVELIRGRSGTPVVLRILPGGDAAASESFLLDLTRGRVRLQGAAKEMQQVDRDGVPLGVGVIRIPNFYFDMEGRDAGLEDYPSSTRDARRLIEELKAEGAQGLVLDLRRNGGGHLHEAISLAGLFVGKGPVVQVRDSALHTQILRNRRQPPVWEGPLVVLVDRLSASASEILAAVIQDYGRGVVVGQRTFGKGTVQNIYRIPRSEGEMPGRLTLTMGKYYRVTGESTQHRGVTPDIILSAAGVELPAVFPNQFIGDEVGESAAENALPWDTIPETDYPGRSVNGTTLSLLTASYERRESEDPDWRQLLHRIKDLREIAEPESVPIHLDRRRQEDEERRAQRVAMTNEWLEQNDLRPITKLEELREIDLPDVALQQAAEVAADLAGLQAGSSPATAASALH